MEPHGWWRIAEAPPFAAYIMNFEIFRGNPLTSQTSFPELRPPPSRPDTVRYPEPPQVLRSNEAVRQNGVPFRSEFSFFGPSDFR